MARLFADENFPLPVVEHLQKLGHTVVTLQATGQASLALTDPQVLALAVEQRGALLTLNRRHFIRLHQSNTNHHGIIVCTFDPDFNALAQRIDREISSRESLDGQLIRIVRPG